MSQGRTWSFVALALLYTGAVSLYVGYSLNNAIAGAAGSSITPFALLMFVWLLASGIGFALMVALLDLFTRRPQQFMAALALGLAVAATYQAVVQVAFEQSYTYWKQHKPLAQNERAASSTDDKGH